MRKRILELGCGIKKNKDSIGVDINIEVNPDVLHDLNIFPYPFENNYFDEVHCEDTLMYLDNFFDTMREIHRITNHGGIIKITNPYFRSKFSYILPEIKCIFSVNSFAFFDPDHVIYKRYKYVDFQLKTERIVFDESINKKWFSKIIKIFANKWPNYYEENFSHIFPLDTLTWYLKKE